MWKKTALLLVLLFGTVQMTSAADNGKVFVIGLDGASHSLMQECMENNDLENINSLASDGGFSPLHSPLPPLTPVAMSSFLTGTNPGEHGIYGFEKRKALSYETGLVHSRYLGKILPQAIDGESVLINVPMTYPAPEINGTVVSGFPGSTTGKYAWPPTVKERIEEINYSVNTAGTFTDLEQLEDEVFDLFQKRQDLALDFMDEKDWRFFMVMFTGDARLQHFSTPENCRETLGDYYSELDAFVGQVQERLNENDTLIVMSNHGFKELKKKLYLYSFLKDHDYLEPNTWPYYKHMLQDFAGDVLDWLGLSSDEGELSSRAAFSSKYMQEIDWKKTQAYTGSFYNGQIFINEKGDEPRGTVGEDEYEQVRSNIIDDLKQLEDPETGEKIVKNIYTKEELYSGEKMGEMPDIVVEMPGYNHIAKFGFGQTFLAKPAEKSAPVRTGFLVANQPLQTDKPTIIDLSTSIASLLGSDFGKGDSIFAGQ